MQDEDEIDEAGEYINTTMGNLDGYAYFVARIGVSIMDEDYFMGENSRELFELLRTAPPEAIRGRAPKKGVDTVSEDLQASDLNVPADNNDARYFMRFCEAMVAAMANHRGDLELQSKCAALLVRFGDSSVVMSILIAAGIGNALLQTMDAHAGVAALQRDCVVIIRRLFAYTARVECIDGIDGIDRQRALEEKVAVLEHRVAALTSQEARFGDLDRKLVSRLVGQKRNALAANLRLAAQNARILRYRGTEIDAANIMHTAIAKQVAAVATVIALREAVKTAENGVRDALLSQQQADNAAVDAEKALAVQTKATAEIIERAEAEIAAATELEKTAQGAATATGQCRDQASTALDLASRAAEDARAAANIPAGSIPNGVVVPEHVPPVDEIDEHMPPVGEVAAEHEEEADVNFDMDISEVDDDETDDERSPDAAEEGDDDAETSNDDGSFESSSSGEESECMRDHGDRHWADTRRRGGVTEAAAEQDEADARGDVEVAVGVEDVAEVNVEGKMDGGVDAGAGIRGKATAGALYVAFLKVLDGDSVYATWHEDHGFVISDMTALKAAMRLEDVRKSLPTILRLHGMKETDGGRWIARTHLPQFTSITEIILAEKACGCAAKRRNSGTTTAKTPVKKTRLSVATVTPPRPFTCPCGVCSLAVGCPCGCASLQEHEQEQREHFTLVLAKDSGSAHLVRAAMRVAEDTKGEGEAHDVVFTAADFNALIASEHISLKAFQSSHMTTHSSCTATKGAFFIPQVTLDTFKYRTYARLSVCDPRSDIAHIDPEALFDRI
ncbi:hypothetical protein JKP88DRAFT_273614 [Tribonema minus]|uniref:Uncharacterized protein n=1 Tax=Tribonema minus TaxID=303371 RepID=A0A835YTJ0_9STRA|nr:hypothetical protein JKP88DRAFT_273614 [Tribonema minus]